MPRRGKSALDAFVKKSRDESLKTRDRVEAKRASRRKVESEVYEAKFSEQLNNGGQTTKERLNWKKIREWFYESMVLNFGDKHTLPTEEKLWHQKEISLAKRLIQLYGGDTIREGIVHLCESWDAMVEDSNGRLSGLPTIGFLWSTKERIIGAVEAGEQPKERKGRKRHHRAEYDPDDDDMPDIGW